MFDIMENLQNTGMQSSKWGESQMTNEKMSLLTKQRIVEALKETIIEKSFSKITVTELIRRCNINRNTFYYHFADIYDLFNWIVQQEITQPLLSWNLMDDPYGAAKFVTNYFSINRAMLCNVYRAMGKTWLYEVLYAQLYMVMEQAITNSAMRNEQKITEEFRHLYAGFLASGTTQLLLQWLTEPNRLDDAQVSKDIVLIYQEGIASVLAAYNQ